ncbi:CinA family protein [Desulfosporosinus sp. SB140]|uniref:CinA family protein n=1 Tax=Desulfosporosinus paludis TaxID=3115649 RepID=UPI00388FB607
MNLLVGTIKAQVNDPNVRVGYLCLFTYNAYSNQQKLFIGIPEDIIEKYGVYSLECAKAMAMAMTGQKNTQADFSVGVTGTFSNIDLHNEGSEPGVVYFSIVFKTEQAMAGKINVPTMKRFDQKQFVTETVLNIVLDVLESIYKALLEPQSYIK